MTNIDALTAVFGIALTICLSSILMFRVLWSTFGSARQQPAGRVSIAGGAAVFLAVAISILAAQLGFDLPNLNRAKPLLFGLLFSGLILFTVGFIHDRFGLRGRFRIFAEVAAITILILYGHLRIQEFFLFGKHVELGALGIALTYVWLIGVINAISLIDGMDGLLGSIGVIVCLSFAIMSAWVGNTHVAIVSAALAGALIGLLFFNLPPASVRLGTGGNMFVGLVLGTLSIQGMMKGPTAITLAVPMTLLILPILDSAAGFARRRLIGRNYYAADDCRLHHRLLRSGMRPISVLGIVSLLGLIASAGAVATTVLHHDVFAIAAAAIVVVLLAATRLFGHAELKLLRAKFTAFALFSKRKRSGRCYELAVRLQGTFQWPEIWQTLTAVASECEFESLCLDVNAPSLHEDYHACWDRMGAKSSSHDSRDWCVELPIRLRGSVVGRLSATGTCETEPIWVKLDQFAEIAKATELHVNRLSEQLAPANTPAAFFDPVSSSAV